ncbi:MAG TPA: hypothetical protein PKA88_18180 [Polyangiaceae bacterium]|nr:hypothetical protein [Polyangiaceae bacterium]HMR79052.1 hypothetical protein [Polyangiaceae bacterium]
MVDPNDERLRYARKLKTAGLVVRIIGATVMVGSILGVLVALNLRRSDDRIGFSLISLAVLLFGALVWGSGMFHSAVARFLPSILDVEAKLDALARPKKARAARATAAQPAGSEASLVAAPVADGPPAVGSSLPDTGSSAPDAYPNEEPSASQANAFLSGPTSTIPEPWTAEAASRVQAIAITTEQQVSETDDAAKDARENGDHSLLAESGGAASESGGAASESTSTASEVRISDAASRIVSDAEPERVPCPHCTGRIHPEASRCVHCMRRVEPHAALPS